MSTTITINGIDVETVLRAYVECALFTSHIEESGLEILRALSHPGDVSERACADWGMDRCDLGADDLHADALASMRADVESFLSSPDFDDTTDEQVAAHERALEVWSTTLGVEQIGHDLWLTRNGHGAGFWDRFGGEQEGARVGRYLTEQARPYGESYLYIGDDGKVHAS